MHRPMLIGIEDYKEMVEEGDYYVDKTLFTRDLLDRKGKVNLFTRPRRFGKNTCFVYGKNTCFVYGKNIFEAKADGRGKAEDNTHYFNGLKIMKAGEYMVSLQFLSQCLAIYHNEKTVILIDEYDVLLENAYFRAFYGEMTDFIRSLFEGALKIDSVLSAGYTEYFGFTAKEIEMLLRDYGLEEKDEVIRAWYDGYLFGKTEVYNPWSILNYLDETVENRDMMLRPYWANTSSNSIVRELLENAEGTVKQEIETLVAGGCIERPDILLYPLDYRKPAVILGLKHVKAFPQMEAGCGEALAQIEERGYTKALETEGCREVRGMRVVFVGRCVW